MIRKIGETEVTIRLGKECKLFINGKNKNVYVREWPIGNTKEKLDIILDLSSTTGIEGYGINITDLKSLRRELKTEKLKEGSIKVEAYGRFMSKPGEHTKIDLGYKSVKRLIGFAKEYDKIIEVFDETINKLKEEKNDDWI